MEYPKVDFSPTSQALRLENAAPMGEGICPPHQAHRL